MLRFVFGLYAFYSQPVLFKGDYTLDKSIPSHLTVYAPRFFKAGLKLCTMPAADSYFTPSRVAISPTNPGMKSYGTRATPVDLFEFALLFSRLRFVTKFQSNFQFCLNPKMLMLLTQALYITMILCTLAYTVFGCG